jgi:hypothetical protein
MDNNKKKDKFSYIPDNLELNLGDISTEFSSVRDGNHLFFGRYQNEEIRDILVESGLWKTLELRGYRNTTLEVNVLSFLDNRIYIKNNKGEILVHMRLKMDDFYFKRIHQSLKVVYIDWLLTQNILFGKSKHKGLFQGQEYPGLNIFKEITYFIKVLSEKIGAHGVFNVPEYFHDAILFHKYFKFLDPQVEVEFLSLISSLPKKNLRNISEAIHNGKIVYKKTGEVYVWKHSEMIYSDLNYIQEQLFGKEYESEIKKIEPVVFEFKER